MAAAHVGAMEDPGADRGAFCKIKPLNGRFARQAVCGAACVGAVIDGLSTARTPPHIAVSIDMRGADPTGPRARR